ncbi:uncharacterized protein LOC112344232 [Selaginella moellendorffii]|uniref:uncharacterized protein LOC112344232 n=1 Tax=Selaginella moellendorffii TaxID=88036 RepID=UPI000D1C4C3D|nr:uncharacterized protein LOC112344232 [Selaginella moellendorffii]|eukprot:XP_024524407.1 uncharacterized protein LOC112344232 [Selaginella moellendorffii]
MEMMAGRSGSLPTPKPSVLETVLTPLTGLPLLLLAQWTVAVTKIIGLLSFGFLLPSSTHTALRLAASALGTLLMNMISKVASRCYVDRTWRRGDDDFYLPFHDHFSSQRAARKVRRELILLVETSADHTPWSF